MSKVAEKREKLSGEILAVAERQIIANGLSGLNARDIAAAAGCAVGTLYNLFDSLDGIILRVNSRTLTRLDTHLSETESSHQGEEPITELVALALSYLDFVIDNRKAWNALFEHQMPAGVPLPEWHLNEHYQLFRHIIMPLSKLSPGQPREDMHMLARSLYSAVHGIVSLGLQDRMEMIPPALLREQLKIVVESFVIGYRERNKGTA